MMAGGLVNWLANHPGAGVICRDRDGVYASTAASVVASVKAPPLDLDPDLIARALDRHWRIRSTDLRYLPVGFGDHHWQNRGRTS